MISGSRQPPRNYAEWKAWLLDLVLEPESLEAHHQPILDLERGTVAGYEVLSRFGAIDPVEVFAKAKDLGMRTPLELRIIEAALATKESAPPNTFLAVHVSSDVIASRTFEEFVNRHDDFSRMVIEVADDIHEDDYERVRFATAMVRERQGHFAIDDAGAGYSSLRHVLALRPQFVKIDRKLVKGIDRDLAKRAVLELLGNLASSVDAWVVAEGVEHDEDLRALIALGIPLAQGFYLARPSVGFSEIDPAAAAVIHACRHPTSDAEIIASLVDRAATLLKDAGIEAAQRYFEEHADQTSAPIVSPQGRALGYLRRVDVQRGQWSLVEPLFCSPRLEVVEAARRAGLRDPKRRLDPLVCRAADGRYLGLLGVDRLLHYLARRTQRPPVGGTGE